MKTKHYAVGDGVAMCEVSIPEGDSYAVKKEDTTCETCLALLECLDVYEYYPDSCEKCMNEVMEAAQHRVGWTAETAARSALVR